MAGGLGESVRVKVTADVSGLAAVATAVKQRAVTLKAVKAGAKIVQAAAKARAPRRKGPGGGGLKQAIGVKAVKGKLGPTNALAVVGPRKKVERMVPHGKKSRKYVPAYTAHLVEGGTQPHAVAKGARKGRAATEGGKGRRARKARAEVGQAGTMHPGSRPQPFIKPAWEANKDRAAAAVQATLGAEVNKAVAQAAKGVRK